PAITSSATSSARTAASSSTPRKSRRSGTTTRSAHRRTGNGRPGAPTTGACRTGTTSASARPKRRSAGSENRGQVRNFMRDYWLSKLFFDLQSPAMAGEFRAERDKMLTRYPLDERVKRALAEKDVPFLAARTNPY